MKAHFHFRPSLLHAVEQIDLFSRRRLASPYVGTAESPFRGTGMQFKEFRQYEPGDDVRHISWTTTAKTGKPILKVYEEEREITVILLVDASGSSLFGSGALRKVDMYAEVIALLGMGALKCNHNVGLLFFDQEVKRFFPPSRSKEQVLTSINFLLNLDLDKRPSDIRPALSFCQKALKEKCLVLILSDFLMTSFSLELSPLGRHHELILLQGYDDSERLISSKGVTEICDPESGDFYLLDSESLFFRKTLAQYYSTFTNQLEQTARECRADFLPLSVQDDYLQRLVHFFGQRYYHSL
ncbi:MAG: DUF58 domain-containing protein [Proteobacteria bacterium]|nr:DUF58 domain-containing protein [Pseudomonadota bacterium]NDC24039.1 DUF58 domain-containing protein [Pseudomonadota bacterium]NDD04099.1 DUF58 domain-containing protein [Pseudomonadota bacterium]NDG27283.1 DUF58 domain-containing protein [Pseudomonadota bacterium]